MENWKEDIIEALLSIGRPAPLSEIYRVTLENRQARGSAIHPTSDATIRANLERYSSDSKVYSDNKEDIFKSTNGIGNGVWELRESAKVKYMFRRWLNAKGYSTGHYFDGVSTISKDLQRLGISENPIFNILDRTLLENLREDYFKNPEAESKNTRGHNMFSRAFDLYIEFATSGLDQPQNKPIVFTSEDVLEIPPEELEYIDGELVERKVNSYKRNQAIIKACKARDNHTCLGCGFHYKNQIVEAHHLKPLHTTQVTSIKAIDLITLCPTCHRLAHTLLKDNHLLTDREALLNSLSQVRSLHA